VEWDAVVVCERGAVALGGGKIEEEG